MLVQPLTEGIFSTYQMLPYLERMLGCVFLFLCNFFFLILGRKKDECMVNPKEKKWNWELTTGCFWGFLSRWPSGRGAGCCLTGFRLACIKNVFRNIKYLGFLNYLFDTHMPLAMPWRMVILHLTNRPWEQSWVCLLPLIVTGWISKIHWATKVTQTSGGGGGSGWKRRGWPGKLEPYTLGSLHGKSISSC